jgi:hypothetical protein
MGALAEGLEKGPATAIEVCQVLAPEIAADLGSAAVEIGRTSHKLRNRANAPREWVRPLLDRYERARGEPEPEIVRLEDGKIGYVEPIFVKPMCLTCHGGDLSPDVAARIDTLYPDDRARGFKEGDFRGLFWIEFRRPEPVPN